MGHPVSRHAHVFFLSVAVKRGWACCHEIGVYRPTLEIRIRGNMHDEIFSCLILGLIRCLCCMSGQTLNHVKVLSMPCLCCLLSSYRPLITSAGRRACQMCDILARVFLSIGKMRTNFWVGCIRDKDCLTFFPPLWSRSIWWLTVSRDDVRSERSA